jgi:uncharacterized protein YbjT (DUF2867 family)
MSHDKKTIAVTGATGAQGGGLARAVLDDPAGGFRLRAITRNPQSDKAAALAARGAEVVAADLDDRDSLVRAFDGTDAAFCVTNFWEHFSPERELTQAGNMAAAAETAGVGHVVWSTLEDTRRWVPLDDDRLPTLHGRYKVPHFDAKGEADRLFADRGLPVTYLLTSFYWDNFVHFGMQPKRGEDGVLAFAMPMGDAGLPGIAAEDIGRCAYGIFRAGPERFAGQTVGIAGGHPTGAEMAASLSRALGEEVRYVDVPPEVYRGFGFPGADDLGNMFQFKRDFTADYRAARDVEAARRLHPGLQGFDEWLAANASRIPIE